MPARTPARPACRDCGGFSTVAITTGARHHDGSRALLRIVCHGCNGTGLTLPTPAFSRTGR
ncbi:hypothetical protein ACIQKE_37900 [Streptomyces griseoviridis]|uniref:hypothetical protein n=1 Tax=Streptomyces sp. NPDC094437 TaxID=3366060 RepID=UPI0038261E3C